MMNAFKQAAAVTALAFGGFGMVYGGFATYSEMTRDRTHEIAGVNLTVPAAGFTLLSGGIFYAGLRGMRGKKDNNAPRP